MQFSYHGSGRLVTEGGEAAGVSAFKAELKGELDALLRRRWDTFCRGQGAIESGDGNSVHINAGVRGPSGPQAEVFDLEKYLEALFEPTSHLNGTHGEVTGSDDVSECMVLGIMIGLAQTTYRIQRWRVQGHVAVCAGIIIGTTIRMMLDGVFDLGNGLVQSEFGFDFNEITALAPCSNSSLDLLLDECSAEFDEEAECEAILEESLSELFESDDLGALECPLAAEPAYFGDPLSPRNWLVGGAFLAKGLKDRGTGGNSKVQRPAQAPVGYVHADHSDPMAPDVGEVREMLSAKGQDLKRNISRLLGGFDADGETDDDESSGTSGGGSAGGGGGGGGDDDAPPDLLALGDPEPDGGDRRQAGLGPNEDLGRLLEALRGRFSNMLISKIPKGATNYRTGGLWRVVREGAYVVGDLTAAEQAMFNAICLGNDLAAGPVVQFSEAFGDVVNAAFSEVYNMHASPCCGLACVQAAANIQPTVESLMAVVEDVIRSRCMDSDLAGLAAGVAGGALPRVGFVSRGFGKPSSSQLANSGLILDPDASRAELDRWVIDLVGSEAYLRLYANSLGLNFIALDANRQISTYAFLSAEKETCVLQHDGEMHWSLRRPRSGKRDGAPDQLGRDFTRTLPLDIALPILNNLLYPEFLVRRRSLPWYTWGGVKERFWRYFGYIESVDFSLHMERRELGSEENVRIQRLRMDPSERNDSHLLTTFTFSRELLLVDRLEDTLLEPKGMAAWFFQFVERRPDPPFSKRYQFSHTNFCAYLEAYSGYNSLNAETELGQADKCGRTAIARVRGVNVDANCQMFNAYIGKIITCFGFHQFENLKEPEVSVGRVRNEEARAVPVLGPLEGGLERISRPQMAFAVDPRLYSGSKLPEEESLRLQGERAKSKTGTYVVKIKAAAAKEKHKNTPVGIAPLGAPVIDGAVLGPGFFAENSTRELIKAYLARIQVRDPTFITLTAFQRFSKLMVKRLLDQVGDRIAALGPEPDPVTEYRRVMRGKKCDEEVARRVDLYERGQAGVLSGRELAKYLHCGVFLKFENNSKTQEVTVQYPGSSVIHSRLVTGGKPRIICTMPTLEEVATAGVLQALEVLQFSDLGEHMVCGLTVEQLAQVIEEATVADHTMTDFSSWESSARREIASVCECELIIELLTRAGWFNLREQMRRSFDAEQRKVYSKNAVLMIDGRHSGKFITYFANCLLNMFNFWWNGYVIWTKARERDLDEAMDDFFAANTKLNTGPAVVSGDDGVVPTGSVDSAVSRDLGFDLGVEVQSTEAGVGPFCSIYAKSGKLYGNIAAVLLKLLWIKRGLDLRPQKQMFLMRMAAYSAWLKYGDHPVIGAMVVAIGRVTAGVTPFKGWKRFTDYWKGDYPDEHEVIKCFPREWRGCCQERRFVVERGGIDRVGVSCAVQFRLEREILALDWGSFSLLEEDPVISQALDSGVFVDGDDGHTAFRGSAQALSTVEALYRLMGTEMAPVPAIWASVPKWDGRTRAAEFSRSF